MQGLHLAARQESEVELIPQPGWPADKVRPRVLLYMEGQKQRRGKKLFVGTRGRSWEDLRDRGLSEVV